jgi:hypothetical protein
MLELLDDRSLSSAAQLAQIFDYDFSMSSHLISAQRLRNDVYFPTARFVSLL